MTMQELVDALRTAAGNGPLTLGRSSGEYPSFAIVLDLLGLSSVTLNVTDPATAITLTNDTIRILGNGSIYGMTASMVVTISGGDVAADRTCAIVADLDMIQLSTLITIGLFSQDGLGWPLPDATFNFPRVTASSVSRAAAISVDAGGGAYDLIPASANLGLALTLTDLGFTLTRFPGPSLTDYVSGLELRGLVVFNGVAVRVRVQVPIAQIVGQGGAGIDQGSWSWEVLFESAEATAFSMSSLYAYLGGGDLVDSIPDALRGLADLSLRGLAISFTTASSAPRFTLDSITVNVATATAWRVFQGFEVTGLVITISVRSPLDASRKVEITVLGDVTLGNVPFAVALSSRGGLANWVLAVRMRPTTEATLALTTFAALPGNPPMQQLNPPPSFSELPISLDQAFVEFSLRPVALKRMFLDVITTGTWSLIQGVLSIRNAELVLDVSRPLSPNRTIDARISGTLSIAGVVSLDVSVERTGGQWRLSARTVTEVSVFQLIQPFITVGDANGSDNATINDVFRTTALKELGIIYATAISGMPGGLSLLLEINNFGFRFFSDELYTITAVRAEYTSTTDAAANPPVVSIASRSFRLSGSMLLYGEPFTVFFSVETAAPNVGNWKIGASYAGLTCRFVRSGGVSKLVVNYGRTLGDIIEILVRCYNRIQGVTPLSPQLPDPWSVLSGISLRDVDFEFFFGGGYGDKVGITYTFTPDVDLVFYTIRRVSVYLAKQQTPQGDKWRVRLAIEGFPFHETALARTEWDLGSSNPPTIPGSNLKMFDLKFLAVGQRLKLNGVARLTSVDAAIQAIDSAAGLTSREPTANPLAGRGELGFEPTASWLLAAKLDLLRFITLGLVFNDGQIAGVRIDLLAGARAGKLGGLGFEILYKKVTESVGVYQIELRLPDAFRQLEFGQVSITLPIIAVDIYTNGNFRIDLGFPKNNDFSRSAMVQIFPFIGAGGFYFALLEGSTATRLPSDYIPDNGTFRPVIECGVGLSLGVGKIIDKGIFRAELSLTYQGILEGVLAFFNGNTARGIPDDLYYRLEGSYGVVGRIQGSVSFAVISANVLVEAYARINVLFEKMRPIVLTFRAGVNVNLNVRVGTDWLGVDVNCSFSTEISESFTIPIPPGTQSPAWARAGGPQSIEAPEPRMLPAASVGEGIAGELLEHPTSPFAAAPSGLAPRGAEQPLRPMDWDWVNTLADPQRETLYIAFRPQFTVEEVGNAKRASYVAMLFLDGTPPWVESRLAPDATNLPRKGDFDLIAEAMLLWLINAANAPCPTTTPLTVAALRGCSVTAADLDDIHRVLTSRPFGRAPFDATQIVRMLVSFFDIKLWAPAPGGRKHSPNTSTESAPPYGRPTVCPFPMIPDLRLQVDFVEKDANANTVLTPYQPVFFKQRTPVCPEYTAEIAAYFEDLAMRFQNANEADANPGTTDPMNPPNGPRALVDLIFEDYFLMLGRGVIQAAKEAMTSVEYTIVAGDTPSIIAAKLGISLDAAALTAQAAPIAADTQMVTGGATVAATGAGETLAALCAPYATGGIDQLLFDLGEANSSVVDLIAPGTVVRYAGMEYSVQAGKSLLEIAESLAPDLSPGYVTRSIAHDAGRLTAGTPFFIPFGLTTHRTQGGDTSYRVLAARFASAPDDASVLAYLRAIGELNAFLPGIFTEGMPIEYEPGVVYQATRYDTLAGLAPQGVTPGDFLAAFADVNGAVAADRVLTLPPRTFTAAAGSTLEGAAATHGVPVISLARANAGAGKPAFQPGTVIGASNVGRVSVGALIDRIHRTRGFMNLGRMVSRFLVPGLRLPSPTGNTNPGPWIIQGVLQETQPLFRLTGQQFILPTFDPNDVNPFWNWINQEVAAERIAPRSGLVKITLDWPGGGWFTYLPPTANEATIWLDGPEIGWYQQLAAAPLQLPLNVFDKAKLYGITPVEFVVGTPVPVGTAVDLGGATVNGAWAWTLNDPLQRMIARPWEANPAFLVGSRPDATPEAEVDPIGAHRWAAALEVRIRKVSLADDTVLGSVYAIDGCGTEGLYRLEQILDDEDEGYQPIAQVHILFAPPTGDAGAALASDGIDAIGAFIHQTNLSTLNHPQAAAAAPGFAAAPASVANYFRDEASRMVRLLWQACSVRSGGYYLYYRKEADGAGLPDHLFKDGSATLTFMITLGQTYGGVPSYANRLVTGSVPAAGGKLFAVARQRDLNIDLDPSMSIDDVIAGYGVSGASLVLGIAGLTLNEGVELTIEGRIATVAAQGYPGWPEAAAALGVPEAALRELNPAATLAGGTRLVLPPVTHVANGTDTLATVAAAYGVTAMSIAFANASKPLLLEGANIDVTQRMIRKVPAVPPGHVGVELYRQMPDATAFDNLPPGFNLQAPWFANQLQFIFSLITFRVGANGAFRQSVESLAKGPGDEQFPLPVLDEDQPLQIPNAWRYTHLVPMFNFWRGPLPVVPQQVAGQLPQDQSPYRGVGSLMDVLANHRDIFGNTVATANIPGYPYACDLLIGYTDPLIGLERWPGVNARYLFRKNGDNAELLVRLNFDVHRYDYANVGGTPEGRIEVARADRDLLSKIYYQLTWGHNDVWIGNSIDGERVNIDVVPLLEFITGIIAITEAICRAYEPIGDSLTVDFTRNVSMAGRSEAYFPLSVTFGIRRNGPVDESFVDVKGVKETSSVLEPMLDATTVAAAPAGAPSSYHDTVRIFAAAFERAYPSAKLATAIARHDDPAAASRTHLWVVQLGEQGRLRCAYDLDPEKWYHYFAPPPLATTLLTGRDFSVFDYGTAGLATAATSKTFASVDLDAWARRFLEALDTVLLPEYSVPARLLDIGAAGNCRESSRRCLATILAAKKRIAEAITASVEPIIADDCAGDIDAARDAFKQKLLVRLSAAYETDAIVQIPVRVTSPFVSGGGGVPPRLYGQPVVSQPGTATKRPELTASTTRIPLADGTSSLTFLFRSEKGEPAESMEVKLKFDPTAIEHEIVPMPADPGVEFSDGFTTSSWLTFVLPPLLFPELSVNVPIPIRSYPVPPSLVEQAVTGTIDGDPPVPPEQITISRSKQWSYSYTYDRVFGGKDAVYATLWFNAPRPAVPLQAGEPSLDLFRALAMFENAWDAMRSDLFTGLRDVAPGVTVARAERALEAFAFIADKVATAWEHWFGEDQLAYLVPMQASDSSVFTIVDESVEGKLRTVVRRCAGDAPLPWVEIPGLFSSPDPATTGASERAFYFYSYDESENVIDALAADGASYVRRTLLFEGLDILNRQNVWAGIFSTRNENLFGTVACNPAATRLTNPAFIYRTPRVRFANALTPLITCARPFDMAALLDPREEGTLLHHLWTFFGVYFDSVLALTGEQVRRTQVAVRYEYQLRGPDADMPAPLVVTLPVAMVPPYPLRLPTDLPDGGAGDPCGGGPRFLCELARTIRDWFTRRSPAEEGGELVFELAVYSSVENADKVPIHTLTNVRLRLTDVTDLGS